MWLSGALPPGVELRPATDDDLPLLARIYASTRVEELAPTGWNDEQKDAFLAFQFRAQHQHYHANYENAQFLVVMQNASPSGRLYLHWRPNELRIVDIAFLPHARGRGIGTALLNAIQVEASRRACFVSIHVEQMNPAMRLYQRLGFVRTGESGVYQLMTWRPATS